MFHRKAVLKNFAKKTHLRQSLVFTMKSGEAGEIVEMRSFSSFIFMNAIAKAADISCFTE